MDRETKVEALARLKDTVNKSTVMFVSDFRGLNATDALELRRAIRQSGGSFTVVKNTIAKRALEDTPYQGLSEMMKGPNGVASTEADPAALAKALVKFSSTSEGFKIKGGMISGESLSLDEIKRLSELPSKDELLAKVLSSINGPASGIVGVLLGLHRNLLNVLTAIKDKKEQ